MSSDQIGGIIRAVLIWLAGLLPATFLNDVTKTGIISGIVTALVAVWSFYTNRPGKMIKKL